MPLGISGAGRGKGAGSQGWGGIDLLTIAVMDKHNCALVSYGPIMPFAAEMIIPAVDRYRRERDRYMKLADRVAEICRSDICEQNAIRAQVTFRVKSLKSFEGKLRRFTNRPDKNYVSVDDIFISIGDLAGVRIAAYQLEDCEKIKDHLRQKFLGPNGTGSEVEIDEKDRNLSDNKNFYRAIHAQVCLPEEELIGTYDNISDISCEVQVCTMIAHVWNEVEHDIGYKPELGGPSQDERQLLEMLGHTVRQGDSQISMLLAANARRVSSVAQPMEQNSGTRNFRDVHDFVSRMRDYKGQAMPNFANNSGQLFDLIQELQVNTPEHLEEALGDFSPDELQATAKKFNGILKRNDLEALTLDIESSDLMLIKLFKSHLDKILEIHRGRSGRGRGRPTRLHRLARYFEMFSSRV